MMIYDREFAPWKKLESEENPSKRVRKQKHIHFHAEQWQPGCHCAYIQSCVHDTLIAV